MQRLRYYPLLIALMAVVAAGVAFTSVHMPASAQTQSPSQTGQPQHGNRVFGTIQSVSADSFVVTGRDGKTYTVKTTGTTKVLTQTPARLSDIHAGDMVRILATKGQDGSLAAVAVQDLPAGLAVGGGQGRPRTGTSGNAANPDRVFVAGSVVQLSGTSLSIASRSGAATTVAVPASAKILRMTTAPWTSLAAGARVSAMGTLNPDGSLAASTVMVLPARR